MINNQTLIQAGIAETRINSILKACDAIHSAVADLDFNNREILKRKFNSVFEVAQQFGKGCPFSNDFEDDSLISKLSFNDIVSFMVDYYGHDECELIGEDKEYLLDLIDERDDLDLLHIYI